MTTVPQSISVQQARPPLPPPRRPRAFEPFHRSALLLEPGIAKMLYERRSRKS